MVTCYEQAPHVTNKRDWRPRLQYRDSTVNRKIQRTFTFQ